MFDILRKSLSTGLVTTRYPAIPAEVSGAARGRPEIDWPNWKDARAAAASCPTGALACLEGAARRTVKLDLARCIFCGLCAEADAAIRMTPACELAARRRADLVTTATYGLARDGLQAGLVCLEPASGGPQGRTAPAARAGDQAAASCPPAEPARPGAESLEALGAELKTRIQSVLGRSLHIREVDAASCNGCEVEIAGLNSPVYDIERLGIHFVASPRHADMLLVTGPVSRNMELALRKTYDATPEPRLVVAVGACGCSGGIFGQNYACIGGVDKVIPVDVYIPGCPPNPHALLHGILTAIGRLA